MKERLPGAWRGWEEEDITDSEKWQRGRKRDWSGCCRDTGKRVFWGRMVDRFVIQKDCGIW